MKYILIIISFILFNCQDTKQVVNNKIALMNEKIPGKLPIVFKSELFSSDKLIHKGIFSPNLNTYYYTVSNEDYSQFDVKFIEQINNEWSSPKNAFFNSQHDEHGMSFSPDGRYLYFSSTRPVAIDNIPGTWHIWRSEKKEGKWSNPEFVDIPNLRDKLVSHPTVTSSGTVYFHASNLDYSEMDIYYSESLNGNFQDAKKLFIPQYADIGKCTPFISPDESYLLFATIGEQLDLVIAFKGENNEFSNANKLDSTININGQGNPYVTPNGNFLFFTTGTHQAPDKQNDWAVKWVSTELIIKK